MSGLTVFARVRIFVMLRSNSNNLVFARQNVVWVLQFDPAGRVSAPGPFEQPEIVPAGGYSVTLAVGEKKLSTRVVVEEWVFRRWDAYGSPWPEDEVL